MCDLVESYGWRDERTTETHRQDSTVPVSRPTAS